MKPVPVVLAALVAFGLTAFLVMRFMPEPVEESDYFVAGSLATMAALLVTFLTLVGPRLKSGEVFFKKRPKK